MNPFPVFGGFWVNICCNCWFCDSFFVCTTKERNTQEKKTNSVVGKINNLKKQEGKKITKMKGFIENLIISVLRIKKRKVPLYINLCFGREGTSVHCGACVVGDNLQDKSTPAIWDPGIEHRLPGSAAKGLLPTEPSPWPPLMTF